MQLIIQILQLFFLILFPYAFLVYMPFWDSLRFLKKKVIAIAFLFLLLNTVVGVFLLQTHLASGLVLSIYGITLLLLSFLVYLITIKADLHKMLYVFFLVSSYSYLVSSMAYFIEARFFPVTYTHPFSTASAGAHGFILLITYPPIYFFFRKYITPLIKTVHTSIWKFMFFIPLLFIILIIIYCNTYVFEEVIKTQYISLISTVSIASFLIYFLTIKMLKQEQENVLLKINEQEVNRQLALQKEYYDFLQNHIEETKQSKQELSAHLHTLWTFLNNKDYAQLATYLESYTQTLNLDAEMTLCEHKSANMLLCYYLKIAQEIGIAVDISGNIKENLSISSSDLCTILGNAFENAIEAASQVTTEKPFITLKFSSNKNTLFIIIDNNFTGEIKIKNGYFLSHKRQGEGVGTASIKAIIDKYQGFMEYTYTEHHFMVSISLPLES